MSPRSQPTYTAHTELRNARRTGRRLFLSAVLFSIFVNLLMLTGPLFMLQVYDRVLNSHSEETLAALFFLVACLFLLMALIDYGRGRVMARVGLNVQANLDVRFFQATLRQTSLGRATNPNTLRDLDALQSFY